MIKIIFSITPYKISNQITKMIQIISRSRSRSQYIYISIYTLFIYYIYTIHILYIYYIFISCTGVRRLLIWCPYGVRNKSFFARGQCSIQINWYNAITLLIMLLYKNFIINHKTLLKHLSTVVWSKISFTISKKMIQISFFDHQEKIDFRSHFDHKFWFRSWFESKIIRSLMPW